MDGSSSSFLIGGKFFGRKKQLILYLKLSPVSGAEDCSLTIIERTRHITAK
jgi:hypothetical protein